MVAKFRENIHIKIISSYKHGVNMRRGRHIDTYTGCKSIDVLGLRRRGKRAHFSEFEESMIRNGNIHMKGTLSNESGIILSLSCYTKTSLILCK